MDRVGRAFGAATAVTVIRSQRSSTSGCRRLGARTQSLGFAPFASPVRTQATEAPAFERDSSSPLFRFGVVADVQYCDIEDATSFGGTEKRSFRGVIPQLDAAVARWNGLTDPGLLFVAQLGDLIDGQNAGKYGQGLKFKEPQSERALSRVLQVLLLVKAPIYHAVGNHELYNFDWKLLRQRLNQAEWRWRITADASSESLGDFYFAFRPAAGWTFLMLNAYEVSLMQDPSLPGYKRAKELLNEYNPNDVVSGQGNGDFFKDLPGKRQRYVPFNGGLGNKQLRWLRREVVAARDRGDRVVVLSHLPLHARAAGTRTLLYDCEECLRILHDDGMGRVVAVFAGHHHRGGYVRDEEGLHHVTLQAPLTHDEAFGHVDVYESRLELRGSGDLPSRCLPLPELHRVPATATPASEL